MSFETIDEIDNVVGGALGRKIAGATAGAVVGGVVVGGAGLMISPPFAAVGVGVGLLEGARYGWNHSGGT